MNHVEALDKMAEAMTYLRKSMPGDGSTMDLRYTVVLATLHVAMFAYRRLIATDPE